eukprot:XP_024447566.1 uncharacterized protein LOC112325356 [Populus trichocarpa]
MTRIEKLETRSDGGRSKRGREARKEESVAGNSADEAEDDLNRGGGFRTHMRERYENRSRRGHIRAHRDVEHRGDFDDLGDIDRNLGSIKLKIPAFKGKIDPEAYLDWEKKVEMIFNIHRYSEEKKVKLAVVEFTDYAMVWWERLAGNKSVEEYQKELEVAMIRANINKDEEVTMSRFLNGLNRDIANVVELQSYVDLEELVHLAIKVEGQLKRKGNTRSGAYTGSSSGWKMNYRREGNASSKPLVTSKVVELTSMKKQVSTNDQKLKGEVQSKRNHDIKCFKCQGLGHYASECANHRVMILRDDGEIVFTSEESDCDDMPQLEDASDLEYVVGDKVLVIRRKAKHDGFKNMYLLEKDGRIYTLAPLSPNQVYEDQIQLKKGYEEEQHVSAKLEEQKDSAKMEKQAEQYGEDVRKREKKAFFNSDELDSCVPSVVKVLLQEFEDVFPDDIPSGLPPIRGIEHQIDFVPGASIPNRSAYRSNPEETKELQRQVGELMSKVYIRESMSTCV